MALLTFGLHSRSYLACDISLKVELEGAERVQSSAFVELLFSAAVFLCIYAWVSVVSVHWRHNTGLNRGSIKRASCYDFCIAAVSGNLTELCKLYNFVIKASL